MQLCLLYTLSTSVRILVIVACLSLCHITDCLTLLVTNTVGTLRYFKVSSTVFADGDVQILVQYAYL